MNDSWERFFRFNRAERYGAIALGAAILLLLAVRWMMPLLVRPPQEDSARLLALNAAYHNWKTAHADTASPYPSYRRKDEPTVEVALVPFDPNSIDSIGIRRLGLPGYVARNWISWRDKYDKKFYRPEDLQPLYALKEEDFNRIRPYIRISITRPAPKPFESRYEKYVAPEFVDITTADTTLLDRAIPGVGAYTARRIIERRDALGGYLNIEQVFEGLKVPDSTAQNIRKKLRIHPNKIRKLSLNKSTYEQLKRHPYIGEKMARNILDFREALGTYESIEQLKQVPYMNGENYRKLAPYFEL